MADDNKPSPETASSSSQPSSSESTQHSQERSNFAALRNQKEPVNRGAGIYAVSAYPSNTLIPFTYTTPTRPSSEAATVGENQGQAAQQQQQPQHWLLLSLCSTKMDQGRGFSSSVFFASVVYFVWAVRMEARVYQFTKWCVLRIPNWSFDTNYKMAFTRHAESGCTSSSTKSCSQG